VSHETLQGKIQEASIEYNTQLRHCFDLKLNDEVKKFIWIATLLDPRFKKLDFFKG
jgi:hypothetical protein|tara:strand:- start:849 stop:1016 length:168 start_codon:yes stop_codon:yes gene_type:complete